MNSGEDESSPRFIFLCKNSKMIMFGKIVLLLFCFQRYFTIR